MENKMSKKLIGLAFITVLLLSGCSNAANKETTTAAATTAAAKTETTAAATEAESTEKQDTADDTVYKCIVAHSMVEDSARHRSYEYFKEELENRTNGRITVEIYANGVMGSDDELMDMCKMGTIQCTTGSGFEKANRKYYIYEMPFMFTSTDEFQKVLDSDFEKEIQDGARANGYYIPATGIQGGFRQITNNVKPINTPDDIAGLKIRVPGLTPVVKTMEILKANPTQISYNDTYLSLQTGVVDGQENPTANIVEKKFYEVQKYMAMVNYIICPECFFTNDQWYSSLPEDLQAVFDEVAKEAMDKRTEEWLASDEDNIKLISENCEVNQVSAENLALFREKCTPVWNDFIKDGYFTQEDLDRLNEILGR